MHSLCRVSDIWETQDSGTLVHVGSLDTKYLFYTRFVCNFPSECKHYQSPGQIAHDSRKSGNFILIVSNHCIHFLKIKKQNK